MNLMTKRFLKVAAGGIGLAAIVLTAPRAVRAAAAVIVQITNTSANPVPVYDTENPARVAYANSFVGNPASSGACSYTFGDAVPAGKTEAVETISADIFVTSGAKPGLNLTWGGYNVSNLNGLNIYPVLTFLRTEAGQDEYVVTQPVKLYVPANYALSATVCVPSGTVATAVFTFSGYRITN